MIYLKIAIGIYIAVGLYLHSVSIKVLNGEIDLGIEQEKIDLVNKHRILLFFVTILLYPFFLKKEEK